MDRILRSVILGAGTALVMVVAVFGVISVARPGWLRLFFRNPVAIAVDASGVVAPTEVGAPTSEPLPSPGAGGFCNAPEQMTLAILGVDDRIGDYSVPSRTDALMFTNLRFSEREAGVLSVPRDLWVAQANVDLTGISEDRINLSYVYGENYDVPGGGGGQLKATVAGNFGFNVDRYVLVNFDAFVRFVDALGGIDVDVPKAIYDSQFPAQEGDGTIVFELAPGLQHMDGLTALRYARTRHQDSDYERIKRQQLVALAIRDRLFSGDGLTRLPALLSALRGSVRTDLSPEEIAMLLCAGPQIPRESIGTYAVDGNYVIPWTSPGGGSVSLPNRETIGPLIDGFLGRALDGGADVP